MRSSSAVLMLVLVYAATSDAWEWLPAQSLEAGNDEKRVVRANASAVAVSIHPEYPRILAGVAQDRTVYGPEAVNDQAHEFDPEYDICHYGNYELPSEGPAVTYGPGQRHAVWPTYYREGDGCIARLYHNRGPILSLGEWTETPVLLREVEWIPDVSEVNFTTPSLCATPERVYLVYSVDSLWDSDLTYDIKFLYSTDDGESWVEVEDITEEPTEDPCLMPTIAANFGINENDALVVCWIQEEDEGTFLTYARSTDYGANWSDPAHLSSNDEVNLEEAPSIAAHNGYFYVTFTDDDGTTWLRRSSDKGVNWPGGDVQVGSCLGPDIVYGESRVTAWEDQSERKPHLAALASWMPDEGFFSVRALASRGSRPLARIGEHLTAFADPLHDEFTHSCVGDLDDSPWPRIHTVRSSGTQGENTLFKYQQGLNLDRLSPETSVPIDQLPGCGQVTLDRERQVVHAVAELCPLDTVVGYTATPGDGAGWDFIDAGHHPTVALNSSGLPLIAYLSRCSLYCAEQRSDLSWRIRNAFVGSATHKPGPPSIAVCSLGGNRPAGILMPVYDSVGTDRSMILFVNTDSGGNDVVLDTVDYLDGSYGDSSAVLAVKGDTWHAVYVRNCSLLYRCLRFSPSDQGDPDTWSSPSLISDPERSAHHPTCEIFKGRLCVAYRDFDPNTPEQGRILRVSRDIAEPEVSWQGSTTIADPAPPSGVWPALSGDKVVVWAESSGTSWDIKARVAESTFTLVGDDTNSRWPCVASDTAVYESPSTRKLKLYYTYAQQIHADTWETRYGEKQVLFSDAEMASTRFNAPHLLRTDEDSLVCVWRSSWGEIFCSRKFDAPGNSWSRTGIASGDLPSISDDFRGKTWIAARTNSGGKISCFYRNPGCSTWTEQVAYTGSVLGAPAIIGAAGDNGGTATAAYCAFVVYATALQQQSSRLVLVKLDTAGSIYYTDTLDSQNNLADSFAGIGLTPDETGDRYQVCVAWQKDGEVYINTSTDQGGDYASKTGRLTWNTENLSNTTARSLHPFVCADADTVLVAWAEGDTGRILVCGREGGPNGTGWGDTVNVSLCPDSTCDFPTISHQYDTLVFGWQKQVSSTNWEIAASVGFDRRLNLTGTATASTYGHVLFDLHQDTIPVVHLLWNEEVGANYSEAAYQRYHLGVEGGGGGGQSASRIDPTIRPELAAPFPNPFNRTTSIRYATNQEGRVTLKVFDLSGRTVRTLVNQTQRPGRYSLTWNARGDGQQPLARGVYFVRLDAPGYQAIRKVELAR